MPKVNWNDILGTDQLPRWTIWVERHLMRIEDEVMAAKAIQDRQRREAERLVQQMTGRR